MATDWQGIMELVLEDDQNFNILSTALEPYLKRIASAIAYQIKDDAIQAAHIAIWRKLDKVDMTRPKSIRGILLAIGVNAIRDEVRRHIRSKEMSGVTFDVVSFHEGHDFEGLLSEYVDYIRIHGTFEGSHTAIARKHKRSEATIRTQFYREANKHFEGVVISMESDSVDRRKRIVEEILGGLL